MRWTNSLRCLTLIALLAGTVLFTAATAAEDEGFTDLFDGKDLAGWKVILQKEADPEKTLSVREGILVCTGQPNGYFYTDKPYKNYVLRYDWQYKRPANLVDDSKFPGNSGCLVHIHPPHKVWPQCVEVQGMNRDHGRLIFLQCKGKGTFDKAAKDKAVKPVGEWNTTEII